MKTGTLIRHFVKLSNLINFYEFKNRKSLSSKFKLSSNKSLSSLVISVLELCDTHTTIHGPRTGDKGASLASLFEKINKEIRMPMVDTQITSFFQSWKRLKKALEAVFFNFS
jgi:hypothetical protein